MNWGDELAVVTAWSVFCAYWDDFCYPFDCVLVWPESEAWALLYHPDERFYFGRASFGDRRRYPELNWPRMEHG
jgi:hypothetical protein